MLGWAVLTSAAVHLAVLVVIPHSVAWTLVLLAMTVWCLKCARCVLRGGSALELLGMCAAMGVAHVAMVVGMPWFATHHAAGHAGHPAGHALAMLGIAAGEFALMFAAALLTRREARAAASTSAGADLAQ